MIFAGLYNLSPHPLRLAAAALLCAALPLLAGCKGNTTSAAYVEHIAGKPPTITLHPANGDPRTGGSLHSPLWQNANWIHLIAPANTARTTTPTRAAINFDDANLYVYFVSQNSAVPATRDAVMLFLDTTPTGDGQELLKLSVDSTGLASATWLRGNLPAEPREDPSPDMGHPINIIPDVPIKGLWTHVESAIENGHPAWTAVIALPFKNLPAPLQTTPVAGAHWKFNLLRNIKTGASATGEQLQSNLSPVYVGAQEFSPHRLADLIVSP